MRISEILRHKGHELVTAVDTETVGTAAARLIAHKIGAVVVRNRFGKLVGILSERDIVRGLHDFPTEVTSLLVADLMTRDVKTCRPSDPVKEVMSVMTTRRIRHLPVLDGDRLVGIVSIGDVVKSRLEEREHEVHVLEDIVRMRA